MYSFKSSGPPYEVKGRGIVRVVEPWDNGLTFGEWDLIIKNKTVVQLDCDFVTILGYEYFSVYREDDWAMNFKVGFLIGDVRL